MKPMTLFVTSFASFTMLVAATSLLPACSGSVAPDDGSSASDALGTKHCGGLPGTPCAAGYSCVDDPSDDCDPEQGGADCPGVCVSASASDGGTTHADGGTTQTDAAFPPSPPPDYLGCGGMTNKGCPAGETCVDDPRDNCDPDAGGADCPGVCQYVGCGGMTNIGCPAGQTCVDDPRDNCDPNAGGADCPGVCQ